MPCSRPGEQAEQVERGYITGLDISNPSVVSVNAAVAALALNEFAIYVSDARPVNHLTSIDLLGNGQAIAAQWTTPLRIERRDGCFTCALAGRGDEANVERYALAEGNRDEPRNRGALRRDVVLETRLSEERAWSTATTIRPARRWR